MEIARLLDILGYNSSPNCLRGDALNHAPDFGHVFRRARDPDTLVGLDAVYTLRQPAPNNRTHSIVPITYVCKANSVDVADEIHRLVWNQNVVPFLIVLAPQGVRVYSGFDWQRTEDTKTTETLLIDAPTANISELRDRLAPFSAESIDNAAIWNRFPIRPQQRVEWRLLNDLRALEERITKDGFKKTPLVHAVIAKFVYLYYLRDREILSDDRLALWDLTWDKIASASAKITAFSRVCEELDRRLNGSIFPLSERQIKEIGEPVLQRVASIFRGGTPGGQLHLDFKAYSFSHIPIETLSVIYEQFLHRKKTADGEIAGEDQAAYYTPIPVVNFMIDRMDEVKPLRPGMRVLDFSCGSGAFLVQCYRRLIEDQWQTNATKPRPTELRDLLVRHIFGMDVDPEACRVAELSLQLTLLDYVEPPDLLTAAGQEHRFKLPSLAETNIFQGNAFDDDSEFLRRARQQRFEWIIGNPPWKGIKSTTVSETHKPVLNWIMKNKKQKPTGGNEAAEAFAWRAQEFASEQSVAGLLMPAMTLFKSESTTFRKQFFSENRLAYVANFANLAEVLFAGRSRVPAATLIFQPNQAGSENPAVIPVFSPLVANQQTPPPIEGKRTDVWNIVIDQDELQLCSERDIQKGDPLTWKLAAWGSPLDERLLRRLSGLTTLGEFEKKIALTISEGLPLRKSGSEEYPVIPRPELVGQQMLDMTRLATEGRFFAFPVEAIRPVTQEEAFVPKRTGFARPESVCHPPHILVSAARNWAVFTDQYLIVPPRQIGIAGNPDQIRLLKALTVLLNSDFVSYHQFFVSTQAGVKFEVSTKKALCALPIPKALVDQDPQTLAEWADLHDSLVAVTALHAHETHNDLLRDLNKRVNAAYGLRDSEGVRISDFVNVLLGLRDGKVENRAVRLPTEKEYRCYGEALKQDLDSFVGDNRHGIQIWADAQQGLGVIQIELKVRDAKVTFHPQTNGTDVVRMAANIRAQFESMSTQWRYFNRNLRLFAKNRIVMFKPLQRFHWLESRAILDAGEIIGLVMSHGKGKG